MSLSAPINILLAWLKWPIALSCLLLLPGTAIAAWTFCLKLSSPSGPLVFFIGGWIAYIIAWKVVFGSRLAGSLFSTMEHELTHALFAWLTLHWVTGFRATWNKGGEVSYLGGGNWLISIAPYWFPTLCVPVMVFMVLNTFEDMAVMSGLLGLTMAYHMTSTWRETHRDQPDLHTTGFVFAWMFLPTANLAAYCLITAFAVDEVNGMAIFMDAVWEQTLKLYEDSGIASHLG